MPRLRNPYGYTIVENAYKQNRSSWKPEDPEWELPNGIRKRNTKQRGEFYTANHNTILKAAAKEAESREEADEGDQESDRGKDGSTCTREEAARAEEGSSCTAGETARRSD